MANLSDVTDPAYLEGLESWELDELRSRRDRATEIETGLSYLRRIVQGRLDIVVAERHRRDSGAPAGVSDLVEDLPAILSGNVHAPGLGRLPSRLAPAEVDPDLEARLEEILPSATLANVSEVDAAKLMEIVDHLTGFERSVSTTRRAVLDVLDRLQDEIVRRYRSGEATVDSLLS